MLSTFHSIELGKKSLMNNQVAVNVIGNNISNVNNPKYSRNRVHITNDLSLYPSGISSPKMAGQLGMGAKIEQIERIRDMFLEDRIISETSANNYWSKLKILLKEVEFLYKEPNHLNLRTSFQAFVSAWDQVGQYPEEIAYRETLKSKALDLTYSIQDFFRQLNELRHQINDEIKVLVHTINTKIQQVADLNVQIRIAKAENQNPNHLLDQRDSLINELAEYVDLSVSYKDQDDQAMLFIGSQILVQGKEFETIKLSSDTLNEGMLKLNWERYGNEVFFKNGSLKSLLIVRDEILPERIKHLDSFALNLMETVNTLHQESFSLKGENWNSFFEQRYINADFKEIFNVASDLNEQKYLAYYRIYGNQKLNENDLLAISGVLKFKDHKDNFVEVAYFETDTLKDVIDRINNSKAQVLAYLDMEGRFSLKALSNLKIMDNDFFIKHVEDSYQFLTYFTGVFKEGVNSVYDFSDLDSKNRLNQSHTAYISPSMHPSAWIALDDKILLDVRNIAVSKADEANPDLMAGKGDGRNAFRILAALNYSEEYYAKSLKEISHRSFYIDKNQSSFQSYLDYNVVKLASITEQSVLETEKSAAILEHLTNIRHSNSGVSMDEEMSVLLMYQKSYQASAKFISYVDQLLETLIFRLGA